jgi:hypothetical protein
MTKILTLSTLVICLTFGIEASDSLNKKVKVTQTVLISDEFEADSVVGLVEKQRILLQKINKDLLHVEDGINPRDSEINLIKEVALFEKVLKGLIYGDEDLALLGTSDKKILAQLKIVEAQWRPFKSNIERYNFQSLKNRNIPLLKSMNDAVLLYAKDNNSMDIKIRAEILADTIVESLNKKELKIDLSDYLTQVSYF